MNIDKPRKSLSPVLIIGIPGPGLIGTLSLSYIIHSLGMEVIGEIEHPDISNVIFVDNGNLAGPIRVYRKGLVYAVLSDIPIDYVIAAGFTESVIDFCKKNKIDKIIVLSGLQATERSVDKLKTYGLVTNERLDKILYENEIPKFLTGVIAGPDATILTKLKNSPIPTLVLYTECNFFFPDPEAAIHTINIISRILKMEIDTTKFKKQVDFLRLQSRQLMEDTMAILNPEKAPPILAPQIYR
ncbi:MAG TPA: PAC2 family protein [Nitrosopumilaceae archaeon]|nr:PAC2 family protein [Nitrosopumilaceae archaeon]